jgi:predicted Rossmann fold flavoprotein
VVVGGGPAGMMAAATAGSRGLQVILIEKNQLQNNLLLGKKMLITGNGRCNVTNDTDVRGLIANVSNNGRFLYSAFNAFTSQDTIRLLEQYGVPTKVEERGKVFPVSNRSKDVVNAFKQHMLDNNVKIICGEVTIIIKRDNGKYDVNYTSDEDSISKPNSKSNSKSKGNYNISSQCKILADAVIVATGGKSYPQTGSTGDGYRFALGFNHQVSPLRPSQVPIEIIEQSIKELQGVSFKDVKVSLKEAKEEATKASTVESLSELKTVYEDQGDMMFTHFGITGPLILTVSAHIRTHIKTNIRNKYKLYIDLLPDYTYEQLNDLLLNEIDNQGKRQIITVLQMLLPKKFILVLLKDIKICYDKHANQLTKNERNSIINLIKQFPLTVKGLRPLQEAIVTAGGIDVKEIDPKTMCSKLVDGIFFVGEVLDVDGNTGGYNIQIALSTGYVAGKNC